MGSLGPCEEFFGVGENALEGDGDLIAGIIGKEGNIQFCLGKDRIVGLGGPFGSCLVP